MTADFSSIYNHHERTVVQLVTTLAKDYPAMKKRPELLADIACVALNRLPPRYIRHEVDFSFYLSEKERADNEQVIQDAVRYAFEFVQARMVMRARL